MNHSTGFAFLGELGLVLLGALAGGVLARMLRLPVLVGYLAAGLALSPHTPGIVADAETVRMVADFGVVLLMFVVGSQFSLDELKEVRRAALVGGGGQIVGTILMGCVLGLALGWGVKGGVFLGCALALSSTAVVLKILEERGELATVHGRILLGILVVQDLSVVLMIVLLPTLSGTGSLASIGSALALALAFVAATVLLATRGAPALLAWIARTGSKELFVLSSLCLCLGAGYVAERAGLGIALGAFLAGIVVSESGFAQEVVAQMRPLRDTFAAIFFVSVGMLLDLAFVASHALMVAGVTAAVVIGKPLLTTLSLHGSGPPLRTRISVGLGLGQTGEFSFVLATLGASRGLIPSEVANVLLASALLSILLTPFVFRSPNRLPKAAGDSVAPEPMAEAAQVIVVGAGRVGRTVSEALRVQRIAQVVVEYDEEAGGRLRESGVRVIAGDATTEATLAQTLPERASLAVVALPDSGATELTVRMLRHLAPDLPIVVRVHRGIDIPRMRSAGATTVIHAEFEAGSEMVRQGLERLGVGEKAIHTYLDAIRERRYRNEGH